MIQSKTMLQLLFVSIVIALLSVYGPTFLFSDAVLQAQFLLVFIIVFSILSFIAYKVFSIIALFKHFSKEAQQGILPQFPRVTHALSIKQVFSFGDDLKRFIRMRLLSQEKLIQDYNDTNIELKSHIDINQKFLKFAHLSISDHSDNSIHVMIQREILDIIDSFDASSFYITDTCTNLLRLDSSVGFEDNRFLLQSVPSTEFSNPLLSEEINIQLFEHVKYKDIPHFITNTDRQDQVFDLVELPIYLETHLYGIFHFYNTNPEKSFSSALRLLLKSYKFQAVNAVTNKILIKKTVFLSKYDSLTGLYNRSYFEQYFEDYNKHALRYKEHYSIILIDLNRLKAINDKFGHVAGDKALQEFATHFKNSISEEDVLARFGGDEFIAIFHNSDLEQTKERLKIIHKDFSHHSIPYGSFDIPIRFSYGIASSPDESMILNILVKIADERMYKLKDKLHEQEKNDFEF